MLAFSLLIVFALFVVVAKAGNGVYEPTGCLDTAYSDSDCFYYAYDSFQRDSGHGFLYYNPYVCNGQTGNIVGCGGTLNFTTYLNYYLAANQATPGTSTFAYFQSLQSTFTRLGPPSNFNQHFCVKNCQFCKLLDVQSTQAINFDPFCPAEVCVKFGLSADRCLPRLVDPEFAGIGIKALTPVVSQTFDIDTEYDIVFSVFGVSNTAPFLGMPLNTAGEGCPIGSATRGLDGLPTGFTFQPDYSWIKQNLNKITVLRKDGTVGKIECALIAPNGGPTERVMVLSGRDVGTESNPPVQIFIDGPVRMSNGQFTTTTQMSSIVGALNVGTMMVSAERYAEGHPLFSSFFTYHVNYHKNPCPSDTTKQILMTTWTKGCRQVHPSLVTFPANVRWAMTGQRNGVRVGLEDGTFFTVANGLSLADDDDDGFVHVCLPTTVKAVNVTFDRGLFFDPRNTMNVRQTARVIEPISLYEPYKKLNPDAVGTPKVIASLTPTTAPVATPP